MAQYPIDMMKRNTGQRFLPVTHPAAIYDGNQNLYQILDDRLKLKASRIIYQNNNTIVANAFIGNIEAGAGILALGLPSLSPSVTAFFEIYGVTGGEEFTVNVSVKSENGAWTNASSFCTNTEPLRGMLRIGQYNNQSFILFGDELSEWYNGILAIHFVSVDNIADDLLAQYSLEKLANLDGFDNLLTIGINSNFAVSNAETVNGYRVDDTNDGTDVDNNALWTAWNIKKKLDEKIGALDVYTSTEVDDLLEFKADKSTIYTRTDMDVLLSEKAPVNHAINSTIYGAGTATLWGHLRLIHGVTSTSTTDAGSAGAVKIAYDAAVAAQSAATTANTLAGTKVSKTGDVMTGNLTPTTNNTLSLGTSALRWNNVYATTFIGSLSGSASQLNGRASSQYVHSTEGEYTATQVNDANYSQDYMTDFDGSVGAAVGLNNNWWHLLYMKHRNSNGYGAQIAIPLNSGSRMLFRTADGTTWNAWQEVIHSGIIGSQSVSKATQLTNARNLRVNLASTSAQAFNGTADATSIGIAGQLPVAYGGTGSNNPAGARGNLAAQVDLQATPVIELAQNSTSGLSYIDFHAKNTTDGGVDFHSRIICYRNSSYGTGNGNMSYNAGTHSFSGRVSREEHRSDYTTSQFQNIIESTGNPSGDYNGSVWLKYS